MKKLISKLLSGTLALMFVGQIMIYGDGSSQGIVHALIKTVGRKNKSEDLIEEYGISSQMDSLYSKITAALEENGLTEQQALDLYNMASLEEYTAKLKGYGALVNDNKKK